MDSTLLRMSAFLARGCALLALGACLGAHAYNHVDTVQPIAPGKLAVACTNIDQDASLIAPGASASDYWEGRNGHYITDILRNPQAAVHFTAQVPDKRNLYVNHAGGTIPYVAIVCYPTGASNIDADYALPGTGDVIPHMQKPGAAPQIISANEYASTLNPGLPLPNNPGPMALPLIVYSHGLTGSPISSGYVEVMTELAAQGFMVAGVFHGDPRFSRVRIEDLSDFVYLFTNFADVVELEMVRPLSLKQMLDLLLADPGLSPGIDATRIGGFGASMGGAAMTMLAGADASTTLGEHCDTPEHDPRIRAFVGYVPWAGYSFLNGFCQQQSGAKLVNRPYLAISGTADTTAPLTQMKQALNNFTNTRYMVEWQDGKHELRPEDVGDLFTWMVTYFNAYLDVKSDPGAFGRFVRMNTVVGGRDDSMTVDVHMPFALANDEVMVRELYNTNINHYYITGRAEEAFSIIDFPGPNGWELTGMGFKAWPIQPTDPSLASVAPVCRFDLNGHASTTMAFFTASASDCASLKSAGSGWRFDSIPFYMQPVDSQQRCPDGYIGVNRAYNQGAAHFDSNHRYSTSDSTMHDLEREGWVYEATVMCSRP
ncbi:MAG TPA: hypothetical protein VH040_06145 [Usitatibacter sp.]|jgi:hypothetical protein|nr:hypothetical protein [Usitatibacter sp.]